MKHKRILTVILALSVALISCVAPQTKRVELSDEMVLEETKKQSVIALQSLMDDWTLVRRVSYPILSTATSYCGEKVRASFGIYFANQRAFPKVFRETAAELYGMDDALRITQVVPGTSAERAGLRQGDVLVSVDGQEFPTGDQAMKEADELLRNRLKAGESVSLTISRAGAERTVSVIPETICDYPVIPTPGDRVNAFADGRRIGVERGMLRFVDNEQELAMVISHELSHNAMGHLNAKKTNYMLGTIFDIVGAVYGVNTQGLFGKLAAQRFSKEFEAEADYVSLYIMAQAGLHIEDAPKFWRRMAVAHPGNIKASHASSHPSTPERFLALEKTVEEIKKKQAANLPLEPEYKK